MQLPELVRNYVEFCSYRESYRESGVLDLRACSYFYPATLLPLLNLLLRSPMPKAVIHDGLPSYDEAFQKEVFKAHNPRIQNIRSVGSNEKGLNPKIERLNGTVRDREITMRGMDNAEAAQELVDAMRIHYNFIRPNQAIGGQTPAEAAGINLNLGENKVESLMRQAAVYGKQVQQEPIVKGLGVRANKVQVLNENDCIRIKAKTWLDKKD